MAICAFLACLKLAKDGVLEAGGGGLCFVSVDALFKSADGVIVCELDACWHLESALDLFALFCKHLFHLSIEVDAISDSQHMSDIINHFDAIFAAKAVHP